MNAALHRPAMPQVETIFAFDGVISEISAISAACNNMLVSLDALCSTKQQHDEDIISGIST
jgi:hypothetical protein